MFEKNTAVYNTNEETRTQSPANISHFHLSPLTVALLHKLQSYGFWILIILGCGFLLAQRYYQYEFRQDMRKIITTGCFYYKDENNKEAVYDIQKRELVPAPTAGSATQQPEGGKSVK